MKRIFTYLFALVALSASAQSTLYQDYIRRYSPLAVEQMKRYGIPASITLAQGLLESGAGTSMLAQKANNHFGIKTGGTWSGPYVTKDDDRKGERFRKYESVDESFEDHSRFLSERQRYASLFNLEPTDYVGWAHGLKAAGYATNPEYGNKLVSLIEIYKLHEYDLPKGGKHHARKQETETREEAQHHKHQKPETPAKQPVAVASQPLQIRMCNGCRYVIARKGDTFSTLADVTGVSRKKLVQFNEVDENYMLRAGEPVYLEKKKAHVGASQRGQFHEVKAGQSMHSISQLYGLRLQSLYRANNLDADFQPAVGDLLMLD
ncbi:MAG: glucosaminidase domain-containing protein [Prevotella sp.]|nr:glucosaminidase domain-containing protein [Prevotella sp.]MBR1652963.1 glucosaminidase domain-containing protein [Alloprevotella sp.]